MPALQLITQLTKSAMKKKLTLLFLTISALSFSQEIIVDSDTIRKDALNVFMSANAYIKKEIPFINYVRDVKEADVYIISTYQSTGSGGDEYTYYLVGQNKFRGMNDTLTVNASPDEPYDLTRIKQVKALKMGLMRYIQKTPIAEYFDIRFTQQVKETVSTDKWNSWVFRTSMSGNFSMEKSYRSVSLSGGLSANRTTEKNKFNFNYSYGWSDYKYDYGDFIIKSYTRTQSARAYYVFGINDHWSVGGFSTANASVYNNYDFAFSLSPAIEYDLFPYSQSTRRQMMFAYRAGYEYYNYHDTTLYNKTKESLLAHSFTCSYEIVEKFGSIEVSLLYRNYLHDWSKNEIGIDFYTSLRLAKGLNFNIMSGGSIIHNQLNLAKGGASYEEMLLRRKEIATSFSLYSYFSISYTFGSIYNNAVNPRLN